MCRETLENGNHCTCEEYDPPSDPNAPSICRECGHGKSRHGPRRPDAVQQPPRRQPEDNDTPPPSKTSRPTVTAIFEARASKHVTDALPAIHRVVDIEEAKQDALKNYRIKDKEVSKKTPKQKPGSAKEKPAVNVKFDQIILLTCGVNSKHQLRGYSKAPTPKEVSVRRAYGCISQNVTVSKTWSHAECTSELSKLFRKAFAFAGVEAGKGTWFVVRKYYQTMEVIDELNPTGETLCQHRLKNDRGSFLFIVLKKAVPQSVYRSWYKGPPKEAPSSDVENTSEVPVDDDGNMDDEEDYLDTSTTPLTRSRKRQLDIFEVSDSDNDETPVSKKVKLAVKGKQSETPLASTSKLASNFKEDDHAGLNNMGAFLYDLQARCLVSPPPLFITGTELPLWEANNRHLFQAAFVNPWHKDYKFPRL
ncbi:hypothetical protein R3P38DRAFT_3211365 [Favolaschia claudopus]|uniref:Uncharacterized protein n=1 Tax=Favolaschia claudopus TaxID=2862362 RepID=A0AAW0AHH0_9AGAR